MMSLFLVALASLVEPHYFTPSGKVILTPATDVIAVDVRDEAALSALFAKAPSVEREKLFGSYEILMDASPELAEQLLRDKAIHRELSAYRNPAGTLMIADGKLRARFASVLSLEEIGRRIKSAGAVSYRHKYRNIFEITAASPRDTLAVVAALHDTRLAVWAEPDFISKQRRKYTPNDTLFADQWHHELIGALGAWELEKGQPETIIAIIDGGVDVGHPDLVSKLVHAYDALGEDELTAAESDPHGTATAGLAGAIMDNELGVTGVCGGCSIMPIRILSDTDWTRIGVEEDAFTWAVDHGAQILSNSWGPAGAEAVSSGMEDTLAYVADEAREGKGAIVFFASGNDERENESYELASHPLVVGVGATDYFDVLEYYSNFGPDLDLVAPAASVTSDTSGTGGYDDGDYTDMFSGTSAACPVAAGVAGLVLSAAPDLTRAQLHALLFETADKVDLEDGVWADGFSPYYGYGRVNALRAVQAALGNDICEPLAEDCDNGVDDDCDFIIDAADTSCAPAITEVGIACANNIPCGREGYCLLEDYGYPDGYCIAGCDGGCPGDSICLGSAEDAACYDGCSSADDCRAGYDCIDYGDGAKVCSPSCKFLGCREGETCDEVSGQCWHDGPVAPGGACTGSLQCADDGFCLRENWSGLPGGFCGVTCDADADCEDGYFCTPVGHYAMCVPSCQRYSDCRDGYTCWPEEGRGEWGICWAKCTRDADCDGEECNVWGLCGEQTPPLTTPPPGPEPEPANPACTCDKTTSCDADCSCDPECKDKGCSSTDPSLFGALLALAAVAARRRSR